MISGKNFLSKLRNLTDDLALNNVLTDTDEDSKVVHRRSVQKWTRYFSPVSVNNIRIVFSIFFCKSELLFKWVFLMLSIQP